MGDPMPKAYVVIDVEVTNGGAYQEYLQMANGTHDPYGGRFVVRGGNPEPVEGGWATKRVVIIEFPTRENALRWYRSAEYQRARQKRLGAADFRAVIVDALP